MARAAYIPPVYPGRITLFRCIEQPVGAPQDPTMGWGAVALEGVKMYTVPGEHETVIREPHVHVLANQLKSCLTEVTAL